MKKICGVILLAGVLLLSGCGVQAEKEAAAIDALILSIGEVTLDSEDKIIEAENSVASLNTKAQTKLTQLPTLVAARDKYDALVIIQGIDEIVKDAAVIENDKATAKKINEIERLYDEASDATKVQINNIEGLNTAKATVVQRLVDKAKELMAQIDSGDFTAQTIYAFRSVYSAIPEDAKGNINYTAYMTKATEILAQKEAGTYGKTPEELELEAQQREQEREAQRQRTLSKLRSDTDRVTGVTGYMSKAQPQYTNTRSYVLPYIASQGSGKTLWLRFNYTGNDWIFFDHVIVAIDGEQYYFYFDYWEITRDVGGGKVWEAIDIVPTSDEISILKAIASSDETIVRFEGDDFYCDFTVSSSDKSGIQDVLDAYKVL